MVYSASQYEYLYDFTEREANRFFAPNQHMSEGSEDETDWLIRKLFKKYKNKVNFSIICHWIPT